MGTVNSKAMEKREKEEITAGSVPTTPILTPRIKNLRDLDPRSPSTNIIRTPIEEILSKKIPNYVEEITVTECGTPKFIRLNGDPRSPNVDYPRTPLVIPSKKLDEPKQIETPKVASNAEKRKSYVLLETNLDYVETDLDTVRQYVSPLKKIEENTKSTENKDSNNKKIEEEEIHELAAEVESVEINKKVPVVIVEEIKKKLEEHTEEIPEEVITNEEDSQPVLEPKEEIEELKTDAIPQEKKIIKESNKDLTVVLENVRDFDKKLTNLIYEDQGMDDIKKGPAPTQLRNRTPLGMRNDNVEARKRIPKLKVADKPRKLDKEFTKIPVLKQKKVRSNVQCENTPPRSRLPKSSKLRKPDWDSDKTMII